MIEKWVKGDRFWQHLVVTGGLLTVGLHTDRERSECRVQVIQTSYAPIVQFRDFDNTLTAVEARLLASLLQDAAAIASNWQAYREMMEDDVNG